MRVKLTKAEREALKALSAQCMWMEKKSPEAGWQACGKTIEADVFDGLVAKGLVADKHVRIAGQDRRILYVTKEGIKALWQKKDLVLFWTYMFVALSGSAAFVWGAWDMKGPLLLIWAVWLPLVVCFAEYLSENFEIVNPIAEILKAMNRDGD